MSFFDVEFYKRFFGLYLFLVLQYLLTMSINLVDNVMLGAYSEQALAGAAVVNQLQFIFQQILAALGEGLVILASQYWGKKQTKPMIRITATAMRAALLAATVLFIIVTNFPGQTLRLFTSERNILAEGSSYLYIIRFTYVFFAVSQILIALLRSRALVKITMLLTVMTLIINCGINYLLINGRYGFPALGIRGAAIGTLIARVVETGVLIIYILKKEQKLRVRIRDFLILDQQLTADYLKNTTPMLIVQGLWGINTALQTVILGHMTAVAIAANSAASNLFLLVKSMAAGAASTASVIIGQAVGMGNFQKVNIYSKRLQRLFAIIGILSGISLYALRGTMLNFYNLAPETNRLANSFLAILSVVIVGMSYQMPTASIVRGGGSPLFVVKQDLVSIWLIVIPLSFIMAFIVKASPLVVVGCLNADQIFKCVSVFIKVNYGNWIRRLTRDNLSESANNKKMV